MTVINRWIITTAISVFLGFVLGYALGMIWFLFSLFILGYGDSGPSWVNSVSDISFSLGFVVSILLGQLFFFKKKGR